MATAQSLTIILPPDVYRHLRERARKTGERPEQLTVEILKQVLIPAVQPPRTAAQVLASLGRVRALSPRLQAKIIPGVTLEEVQEALGRAAGRPLSEIIIEQRGLASQPTPASRLRIRR